MIKRMTFRSRFWPVLFGLCALILISAGAGYLEAWNSSGRILERERKFVHAGLAERRARHVLRPNLFEPAEEGNSWDILKGALPFWNNSHIDPERRLFHRSRDGRLEAAPQELNRVLESLHPRIEILRRALRRRHVEPNHDYDRWEVPHLLGMQHAGTVMTGVAAHLQREGRHDEALDHILICFGLADHLRVKGLHISVIFSLACDRDAFNALERLLADHGLDRPSLQRLARSLEGLESSWPHPKDFYRDSDLDSRHFILRLAERGPETRRIREESKLKKPGWHDWFSERIQLRRLVRIEDTRMAILDRVLSMPVSEWTDAAKSAESQVKQQENSIWDGWGESNLHWYLKSWGEMRMNLALARIAAALALYDLDHEDYPSNLAHLVPKYLPSLIHDPYGNAEFGYWIMGNEATLVSRTRDPSCRQNPVGAGLGPEADGFPAWRVKRK